VSQLIPSNSSSNLDLIRGMQAAAFAGDWQGFQTFFTPRTRYRVGNVVDLVGAVNIARYLEELFATTFQFSDMLPRDTRQAGDTVIVEYDMGGIRLADRTQVRYPCVDVYGFGEEKFQDWRVYPIEPQFITQSPRVSVESKREVPGSAAALPEIVQRLQQTLGRGDLAQCKSFLTPDAVLRVGNNPEVSGPEAFVQHLGEVFSKRLRPTAAEFVNVWNFPDASVVELTVEGVRMRDGQPISYRCAETYHFANNLIREYRIYPLEASLLSGG
jgi:ketosteroid isomerase-like protein